MTGRWKFLGAALALIMLTGSVQAARPARAPQPLKRIDLKRFYTGQWIEIARHPMKITNGCVAGATDYKLKSPTRLHVLDTCHAGTPTGKLKKIGGPARIEDPGFNAKFHVSYRFLGFIPVGRDYWVLDHDKAYTWFISADPSFKNLWIYTRDPHVDPALLKKLVGKVKALGYDPSKLEFPAQP